MDEVNSKLIQVIADMGKMAVVKIEDTSFTIPQGASLTIEDITKLKIVAIALNGSIRVAPVLSKDKRICYKVFLDSFNPEEKTLPLDFLS
jgi:hypothetical protein